MGSETTSLKLPAIDFSTVEKPGSPEWEAAKAGVRKALEEYGCFEATFDQIPLELKKSTIDAIEELFDLPLQTKIKNVSKMPFHGYVDQYPMLPLYESLGIEKPNELQSVESFSSILWPQGHPRLCKTIQSYSEQLAKLDQTVRRLVLESLGLEKYMDEHMDSTYYLLRVMKYKEPQVKETKVGLHAHTDRSIVSILCQNQVDGLEVQTKDGQWINVVKPSPESFVVMAGDCFHAWTNGRLYSAFHRVMMSGEVARYSAGLFSVPKAGYEIKAPEELVDEEHPLLFKPFDYAHFVDYTNTPQGLMDNFVLKTYCGV